MAADARLDKRLTFDVYFAMIFLCALYGFSVLKILLILYVNYSLASGLPRHYIPYVTWIFNIGILFANELCHGYPYASIVNLILPWAGSQSNRGGKLVVENWGSVLDSYGGLISRWEILFNLTILRLISFNLDYYWSLDQQGSSSPLEVCSN